MSQIEIVPLEQIDPNPYQPRQKYDFDGIESLARGIKIKREQIPDTLGLMQVPIARKVGDRYQLAFGHRRNKAFAHLYRTEVSASDWIAMPLQIAQLSDEEMFDFMARENGDRQDLNDIEKAQSIQRAQEEFGWNLTRAANAHGLSKSAGSNLTRLLQLPEAVQSWVAMGSISQRHARELVRLIQCDKDLESKCVDLGRKSTGDNFGVDDLKYEVDDIIREHTTRKSTESKIAGKTCPRCGSPVKMHEKGTSFGCVEHTWTGVVAFDMEWSSRKHREEEEQRKEERLKETHTRYCNRCNAPQDFNGQELHERIMVTCDKCDQTTSVFYWRPEPMVYKPLDLEGKNDGDIPCTVSLACPFWTRTDEMKECYICGEPADYHNDGHTKISGADIHLCKKHYWDHLSQVNGHNTEESLREALDKIKAGLEKEEEVSLSCCAWEYCNGDPTEINPCTVPSDTLVCTTCGGQHVKTFVGLALAPGEDERLGLKLHGIEPEGGSGVFPENTNGDKAEPWKPRKYANIDCHRCGHNGAINIVAEEGSVTCEQEAGGCGVAWRAKEFHAERNLQENERRLYNDDTDGELGECPACGEEQDLHPSIIRQDLDLRCSHCGHVAQAPEWVNGQGEDFSALNQAAERHRLAGDIRDRFVVLLQYADLDQLRQLDAWLDDVEGTVFPENTPKAESELEVA